ncbi:MAG: response regulator [Bacteroidia bacterium]|nr:response regulator [Bacteroidia bacterium]MCZ2276814.1 response regulator [Bacteroidia bacterium]
MISKLYNILLVDDDLVDVMNVQRAFKKNNILNPLYVAHNGIEALDKLRGTEGQQKIIPTPQLILLDINMPRMNGIEFLRELRKDPVLRCISVIIMTTSNDDKDKFEAYNLNVAGYIVKPVSFEKFVQAVSVLNTYWQLCEMPQTY